jgi:hypothetical protein
MTIGHISPLLFGIFPINGRPSCVTGRKQACRSTILFVRKIGDSRSLIAWIAGTQHRIMARTHFLMQFGDVWRFDFGRISAMQQALHRSSLVPSGWIISRK